MRHSHDERMWLKAHAEPLILDDGSKCILKPEEDFFDPAPLPGPLRFISGWKGGCPLRFISVDSRWIDRRVIVDVD